MKIPEKAPEWLEILKKNDNIFDLLYSEEAKDLFFNANRCYHYWDHFKYYKFPDNFKPEIMWSVLKYIRFQQKKSIPLTDKIGTKFGYWLTDYILEELNYIDTHPAFHNTQISDSHKSQYLLSSIMEEAIASSQLEGAASTREAAKEMLRSEKKPANISDQMILNNYITIKTLKEFTTQPLTIDLIQHIQRIITKDTLRNPDDSGKIRTQEDNILVVDTRDGITLFEPPASNEIDERIESLCEYVNTKQKEFVHPVIKAIIIHFWLAYIHPFTDGNGRTARALFYWFLLKEQYPNVEYLALSRIIKSAPAQYARAYLYSEMDDCDLAYFLTFNVRVIHDAIRSFDIYVKRKQSELRDAFSLIKNFNEINIRQRELIKDAISKPDAKYTIKFVMNTYNVVYQTARTDLLTLAKKEIFIKKKIGKEFYFIPSGDIKNKINHL